MNLCNWRVITTLTEQLQWILPWVRWKQICWITLRKLHSNWHLTHSMEQSPSGEANRLSASQAIPRTLYNSIVHYRIYKSPSNIPILNQINSVHAPQSNLLKIRLLTNNVNFILPFMSWSSKSSIWQLPVTKWSQPSKFFLLMYQGQLWCSAVWLVGTNCTAVSL
jgi:hypothetical protein